MKQLVGPVAVLGDDLSVVADESEADDSVLHDAGTRSALAGFGRTEP
jgi:hypothetical protein